MLQSGSDGNRADRVTRSGRFFILLVFILPVVAYSFYFNWLQRVSPFYEYYDPEFAYLLNSLEVFKGEPYAYIDHPGTPLESIGSVIYAGTYPFLHKDLPGFVIWHLENPGLFLTLAHLFLLLVNVFCIVSFFNVAAAKKDRLEDMCIAGALSVLFFVIHPLSFFTLIAWSHNSLSFAFGTLLLLVLYRAVERDTLHQAVSLRKLVGLGIAVGIFASITIYLATWVIGAVITLAIMYRLQRLRLSRIAGALATLTLSCLGGFLLAVLPILPKLRDFITWVTALLTQEDPYGMALPHQPILIRLQAGFVAIARQLPVLAVFLTLIVVLTMVALWNWRGRMAERPGLWAILLGLLVQAFVLLLFFADRPVPFYLTSVAAIVPVLTMALLRIFEHYGGVHRLLKTGALVLLSGGLLCSFGRSVSTRQASIQDASLIAQQTSRAISAYASQIGKPVSKLTILWSYGSYSPCYSLWFGDRYAGGVFRKEISRICPHQHELNVSPRGLAFDMNRLDPAARNWDVLIGLESLLKPDELSQLGLSATSLATPSTGFGTLVIVYRGR